jgi:hypothetical protein
MLYILDLSVTACWQHLDKVLSFVSCNSSQCSDMFLIRSKEIQAPDRHWCAACACLVTHLVTQ